MTRIETRPFDEGDLDRAGRLLADRHRRHRLTMPLLSARFEFSATAEAEVTAAWKAADASGAVALRGGQVVGYLLGAPRTGSTWGPNVWVESAGLATADPGDQEVVRALYAEAVARWVDEGRTAHYVVVPAQDEGVARAWFRLAFGHQHTHAVRPLPPAGGLPASTSRLTVRRAVRADIPVLARLDLELPRHQGMAPTFSTGPVPTWEESIAEWEEDWDDPDLTAFVAEHDGTVVGSAVGCPVEKSSSSSGLVRPDAAAFLAFAAVFPEARRSGAGRALGEAVLRWAAEDGRFTSIATDWRETNLLSSRAWRALGYQDSFWRLHRLVGH